MSLVTIVLPTLGYSKLLPKAIKSVESQTKPCELMVVRDEIRQGAGPTRNSVADSITTEWVGFVDDDDELDKYYAEWLEEEAGDNDVVVFRMKYMKDVWATRKGTIIPNPNDSELRYGNVGISFAMKSELFKTHQFIRERVAVGTDGEINEDWEMLKSLMDDGYKIHVSDRVAYYVRPSKSGGWL